jgi:HSP20 family molecular chaperone IbpA
MATEATDRQRRAEVAEATRSTEETMRPQTVPVNVYETDGAMVVVAPLPAVQPGDVSIDLWPGKLRITAHLRSAPPRDYLVHEWDYGGFERELEVPTGFGAAVEASLANGQLAVRVLRGHHNDKLSITPTAH